MELFVSDLQKAFWHPTSIQHIKNEAEKRLSKKFNVKARIILGEEFPMFVYFMVKKAQFQPLTDKNLWMLQEWVINQLVFDRTMGFREHQRHELYFRRDDGYIVHRPVLTKKKGAVMSNASYNLDTRHIDNHVRKRFHQELSNL